MEAPDEVTAPEYQPPILDVSGHFITANRALKMHEREKVQRLGIIKRNNERLARKMDAAKFLDEAKRGL